jgi:hypothetical protein
MKEQQNLSELLFYGERRAIKLRDALSFRRECMIQM